MSHDGSGSESENADELHAHVCTRHHHHGRIDEASDEEEEDEEEEEEEEEMEECETDEEVNMHMRVVGEVDESKDDLSEYSAEECEGDEVGKPGKTEQEEGSGGKERQSKLPRCRKHPKRGLIPHVDELSSTPKRRGRHDCCAHRHHVKGSPAQLNMSQGNQSVDSMKHMPCTSGVSSGQVPCTSGVISQQIPCTWEVSSQQVLEVVLKSFECYCGQLKLFWLNCHCHKS